MWKVLNLLQKTTQYFEKKEIPHPRASSEILLASVLGCSRTDLYVRFNEFVNDSKLDQYRLLVERRAKNEPVAYITGHREFWSLDFDVGPGVLIPRPETEHLVEEALKIFKGRDNWSSFELGLGSGIISVSLAQECEGARLVGADISEEALIYARRNATKHGVSIDIRLGSGFDVLKEGEKFDLIISNPPYCTTDNIDTFRAEVLEYEPTISLNGGLEGIDFHKLILEKAPLYLNPGGVILMEMAPGQEKLLLNICQRNTHYKNIEVIPDYSGRNRIFKVIYG